MKLTLASEIADEIIEGFWCTCYCIVKAGSVRRGIAEVKDIEICYIPRLVSKRVDLFTYTDVSATDGVIADIVACGFLAWDEEVKRNGPKYKRLIHVNTGIVVELFAATLENWGLILALRTGPAEFNHKLVTQWSHGGIMPMGMAMRGGYLWRGLARLESPDEETFFGQIGIPNWAPRERSVERLRDWLKGEMKVLCNGP